MTSVSYPTTALNVGYVYDTLNSACPTGETYPKGHLTQITDSSGNTQFCYDRFGNLTRKVQVNGSLTQTTRFEYTLGGELYRVTYPSGAQALYGRNLDNKINNVQLTIGSTTSTLVSNVMYAAFGPMSVLTFGNGRLLTNVYDLDYNLGYNFDIATGGLNLATTFDDVGNLKWMTSTLNGAATTRNYTYDGLDRLTFAWTAGTSSLDETFTYDATGNRLSKQLGTGVAQAYVYPSTSHRLTSIAAGTARTYDNDGSTLTEDGGSGILTFVYDDRERMAESKISGAVYRDYKYNGRGERVSRIDPANSANTVNFVYDEAGHLLGDYTSTGTALHEYVWLDDTLVGVIAPSEGSTAGYEYVETDQIGTPRVVIDPVRNVAIWRWNVTGSTFGDHLPDGDADGNGTSWAFNLRYPGQYYEGGYGLPNYNYLRDYEAATGRYVESDPIGLGGGVSTYGYAGSRPVSAIDPSGLFVEARYELGVGHLSVYDTADPLNVYGTYAKSGGTFLKNGKFVPNGTAIPVGVYDILGTNRPGWFRLDPRDSHRFDDTDDKTGRGAFRLHPGTHSLGCVTIDKNSNSNALYENIDVVIRNTFTTTIDDHLRRSLIPGAYPIRYGGPVNTPVTYYGTLTVTP